MCVTSYVMDQGLDDLQKWRQPFRVPLGPLNDSAKLDRIIELLEKMMAQAAEYDRATGQPECEHEDKKQALREIADKLGVEIQFPN